MADAYRPGPRPHPTGYSYPQDRHLEAVFVNAAREDTSITRMTVPLLLVGSLVVFVSVGTYLVTANFAEIKHALTDIASKMEDLKNDRYTRTQHDLWCSRTEQLNSGLGWRCADVDDQRRMQPAAQVNGWEARRGK